MLEFVNEAVHHPVVKGEDIALGGTFLLVEPVGNSSSSWLVASPGYVEARDDPGILGGLSLRVVEVGVFPKVVVVVGRLHWYSHHSILYVMTQVGLSILPHGEVGPVTGVEVGYDEDEFVELEHIGVELGSLAGN